MAGSEFKAPPSSKEVQAKTQASAAAEIARAHEAVFGEGSASLKGPGMPENWRKDDDAPPVDPKFIPDPGPAPTGPPEPEFTEEDKDLFLRSILSGKPFLKSVSLFGGQMTVRLRTKVASEAQELVRASMAGEDEYLLNMQMELDKGHLAYGLVSIEDETGKILDYDNGPFAERVARIEALPYPKYSILDGEMKKFDRLVDFFIRKANEPGFWHPAAGT